MSNGHARPDQAPLLGQQRVRLLAGATCLLLVGWQAPGSSTDSSKREGRVLMHLEGSAGSSLGGRGQLGRTAEHGPAASSLSSAGTSRGLLAVEEAASYDEDAGKHWRRQLLGGEERQNMLGHHALPKWARWGCSAPYSLIFTMGLSG